MNLLDAFVSVGAPAGGEIVAELKRLRKIEAAAREVLELQERIEADGRPAVDPGSAMERRLERLRKAVG